MIVHWRSRYRLFSEKKIRLEVLSSQPSQQLSDDTWPVWCRVSADLAPTKTKASFPSIHWLDSFVGDAIRSVYLSTCLQLQRERESCFVLFSSLVWSCHDIVYAKYVGLHSQLPKLSTIVVHATFKTLMCTEGRGTDYLVRIKSAFSWSTRTEELLLQGLFNSLSNFQSDLFKLSWSSQYST